MGVCGAGVKWVWVDGVEGESGEGESEPGVGGNERCVRVVVVVLCTAMAGESISA